MSQQKRLSYLLALNIAMIVGLVTVGLSAHSLSVLAAGGDFIVDSFAVFLGIVAVRLRSVYGYQKAPTYVALVNAVLLLGITAFVIYEAAHRLLTHTPEIHGLPVLIVSIISTLVMLIGALILGKGAGKEDLHMRSVLLDTLSDGLSAAGVAIVGAIIFLTHGHFWLDSLAAIVIGLIVAVAAIKLLADVQKTLRQYSQ